MRVFLLPTEYNNYYRSTSIRMAINWLKTLKKHTVYIVKKRHQTPTTTSTRFRSFLFLEMKCTVWKSKLLNILRVYDDFLDKHFYNLPSIGNYISRIILCHLNEYNIDKQFKKISVFRLQSKTYMDIFGNAADFFFYLEKRFIQMVPLNKPFF